MRHLLIAAAVLGGMCSAAWAQDRPGIGIGPRISIVRGSAEAPDTESARFTGGVLRLGGGRSAIELAMDYRSGVTGTLTERIKSYPIQASLLLFPMRAALAPYVLGGVGWYTQKVTQFSAPTGQVITSEETTRKMGFHGGFGAEIRAHRRLGIYGDYRYTRIRFGGDEDTSPSVLPGWIPGAQRLKLSHEGSMFTFGATVYF